MLLRESDKGMSNINKKIADKDINFFGNVKSHELRMLQKWRIIIIAACEWKMCEIGAIVGGMSVKMSNFVV